MAAGPPPAGHDADRITETDTIGSQESRPSMSFSSQQPVAYPLSPAVPPGVLMEPGRFPPSPTTAIVPPVLPPPETMATVPMRDLEEYERAHQYAAAYHSGILPPQLPSWLPAAAPGPPPRAPLPTVTVGVEEAFRASPGDAADAVRVRDQGASLAPLATASGTRGGMTTAEPGPRLSPHSGGQQRGRIIAPSDSRLIGPHHTQQQPPAERSEATPAAGAWSSGELAAFEVGVYLFGREFRGVQLVVGTKTVRGAAGSPINDFYHGIHPFLSRPYQHH